MPNGKSRWFYNYLGAIVEASARGMALPVESDWTTASRGHPRVTGEFPGFWLPLEGKLEYAGIANVSWMDYAGRWPIGLAYGHAAYASAANPEIRF